MTKTTRNVLIALLITGWTVAVGAMWYEMGTLKVTAVNLQLNEAQLRADLAEADKKTAVLLIEVHKKANTKLRGLLDRTIEVAEALAQKAQACNDALKEQDKKEGLKGQLMIRDDAPLALPGTDSK